MDGNRGREVAEAGRERDREGWMEIEGGRWQRQGERELGIEHDR